MHDYFRGLAGAEARTADLPLIAVLLLPLLLFAPGLSAQESEELPPLTESMVRNVMLMEFPHLRDAQLSVLDIQIEGDSASVRLAIDSVLTEKRFKLVTAEAGRFWQLQMQKRPGGDPAPEQRPPTEEQQQPIDPISDPQPLPAEEYDTDFALRSNFEPPQESFQVFLKDFFNDARTGGRETLAGYFFKESDFNWNNVSNEEEDPRASLQQASTAFLERADYIATVFSQARDVEIVSYITSRSTAIERAMLRQIMPRASRYIKEVIVELYVDNEPARITFEGVTYVGSGWRIGAISEIELPQPLPQ